jgi:hypothetical protein
MSRTVTSPDRHFVRLGQCSRSSKGCSPTTPMITTASAIPKVSTSKSSRKSPIRSASSSCQDAGWSSASHQDQSQSTPRHGRRGYHQFGQSLPLRRRYHAPRPTPRTLNMSCRADSQATERQLCPVDAFKFEARRGDPVGVTVEIGDDRFGACQRRLSLNHPALLPNRRQIAHERQPLSETRHATDTEYRIRKSNVLRS